MKGLTLIGRDESWKHTLNTTAGTKRNEPFQLLECSFIKIIQGGAGGCGPGLF